MWSFLSDLKGQHIHLLLKQKPHTDSARSVVGEDVVLSQRTGWQSHERLKEARDMFMVFWRGGSGADGKPSLNVQKTAVVYCNGGRNNNLTVMYGLMFPMIHRDYLK